jgi:hypothetical protein
MFIGGGKDYGMAFSFLGCTGKLHNQNKVEIFNKIGLEIFVIPIVDVPSNGAKRQRVCSFGLNAHVTIEKLELGCDLDLSIKQIPPTPSTRNV